MPAESNFKAVVGGAGQAFAVAGSRYTIKAGGEETGGRYALIEMLLPPGAGPPEHTHTHEDESFYILEGEVRFESGEHVAVLSRGGFLLAPRGLPHTFRNVGPGPARVLLLVTPAGLEKFFQEVGTLLSGDSPAPLPISEQELERLKAAAPHYDLHIRFPE